MIGHEGTPWVSVEVERATPRDRPYGWIVTVRTPGLLQRMHGLHSSDVRVAAAGMLEAAVRREIPIALTRAEPLPPSRRLQP